jgi:hypothetical protein
MTRTMFIAAALALAVTLPIAPAQATGAPRTFVSAAGSDSNNCTNVATPCRHLATAYAATAANGEIYVLDPANYGSLTITGPVSIEGHGWASIAPVSGDNAITINANPSDAINIIGVVLDGTALANTNGIQFNSGGSLTVRDSVIRNFSGSGIYFVPSATSNISVSNTLAADNGTDGITIFPTSTATVVTAAFDHVQASNNGQHGIGVNASRGEFTNIYATASESTATHNLGDGFRATSVTSAGTTGAQFVLFHCVAASNATGIEASGKGAIILVAQTMVDANTLNWKLDSSGIIGTFADNYVDVIGTGSLTPFNKF